MNDETHKETILEIIREFIGTMTVSVDSIEVFQTPAHPLYIIKTNDSKLLIGPQGEHLRALNTILKRIIEQRLGLGADAPSFFIDVNEYHKKHIEEIQQNARLLADRVRMFKSDTEMSPMNAYERMIIHASFANDPDIVTESEGEGKFRHIVLRYKQPISTEL